MNHGRKTTFFDLHLEMLRGSIVSTCIKCDSFIRGRALSKSMANLFFQKEIMSPKMSYFDSSRSVQALEQVVAETEPS